MKRTLVLLNIIVTFLTINAQKGSIKGRVMDVVGEVIPFANVILIDNIGVSTGRATICDLYGFYSIKSLSPGKYNVRFSYTGYETQIKKDIAVDSVRITWVDVNLKSPNDQRNTFGPGKVHLVDPR